MRQFLAIIAASALVVTPTYAGSPPKPTKPVNLVTTSAGFAMSRDEGLRYAMNYELQTAAVEPLYVVAVFENPVDAANPLRTELVVAVGAKQFTVQSPAIKAITNGKNYEVLLKLYADTNHTQLLGTHKQSLLFNTPPESKATLEKQLNIQIR